MSDLIPGADHRHARFAVIGGGIGAVIAVVLGVITKFLAVHDIYVKSVTSIMVVWPWFMGFAFAGADAPPFSAQFLVTFLFSIFLNFVTYWVISGIIWCGRHWHWAFFILAAAPVGYYWYSLVS